MTDWDDDSEQLRANLRRVLFSLRREALARTRPTVEASRRWHRDGMHRLRPPEPGYVGRFRGEPGLETLHVTVDNRPGVRPRDVADALQAFEQSLQRAVGALDSLIKPDQDLSADEVAAVIDLCAWVHSEWVRIHPFANGNGRTARLWANLIAMRYGLPPFVRLRPRPDGAYGAAAEAAMEGRRQPTVHVFRQLYREAIPPLTIRASTPSPPAPPPSPP